MALRLPLHVVASASCVASAAATHDGAAVRAADSVRHKIMKIIEKRFYIEPTGANGGPWQQSAVMVTTN